MSDATFLSGKVTHKSLPLAQIPTGPDAPRLKRLLLPQGELAQFHDSIPARYIAYIELRTGIPRGNHFHKTKVEYVYVIAGEMMLEVEDTQSHQRASIPLRPGDLALIEPAIAHALVPLTPGHAIEFSEAPFDAADIFRFPLSGL